MDLSLSQVSVLAELDRCAQKFEYVSDTEIRVLCPFHADKSPSCCISITKHVFNCPVAGCGASGDFVSYLARVLQTTRATVLADLCKRYVIDTERIIDPEAIERWHKNIWSAYPLLKALHERAIDDDLIRQYRLGEDNGRVTIPIKSENGHYVNVRKYLPGAPGKLKMRNMRGRAELRLWPPEQLQYDMLMLCGGEMKAICAASQLNPYGIGAITATGGEGEWSAELTAQLAGKSICVCLDIDAPGRAAAEQRCAALYTACSWVGNLLLPLDPEKFPKGDVNDYVAVANASEDRSVNNLFTLLSSVEQWEPQIRRVILDDTTEPERVDLRSAIHAQRAGKRIALRAVVSAVDTVPYVIPSQVVIRCDKAQPECAFCLVFSSADDEQRYTIPPEAPALIAMVNTTTDAQRTAIMQGIGIPTSCKSAEALPQEFYNIEDTRIMPQLEITNRAADTLMQPALCIGPGIEPNESYEFVGRMHPHPKNQQSVLLISKYQTSQDALSTYQPHDLDRLHAFRPAEWTVDSLGQLLQAVYNDLSANVTRIFKRPDIQLLVDLTYHSPLLLNFDGRTVKGWVESIIVGDTSQGKSETTIGLMQHYGLGEKVECKNASVAGLIGGLQKLGDRWFVSWGMIPTHDKRLIVLEELKGASTEVIAKLTDMRSSGIAEIDKIEKRRTHARTRLIALSNTRTGAFLSTYNFGIEAIREVVGGLEDVRRFDVGLLVNKNEIDPAEINQYQKHRPEVEHVYTSDLCRELILWAWTRTPAQIEFDDAALGATLQLATELSAEFTDAIPLIDRGSARYKIARLAAALAARTFSCDDTGEILIVQECHVRFIAAFLRRIYSSNVFGYADYTEAMRLTTELLDPVHVQTAIVSTPFPRDFIKQILHTSRVELIDIQDWCGWGRIEASALLSILVRKHCLIRDARAYRKTPEFIVLLKELLDRNDFSDRPDFVQEI